MSQREPTTPPARFGKDHLNLADWRIGVPTHQQPRKIQGEKLDRVEYVIERAGKSAQRVTLEAPATIGLPTASDEDVIIGLLAAAKEQAFPEVLPFVPWRLLQLMRWPINQKSFDRLKKSLKRLRAVTVTYEQAWYSRKSGHVEPVLITGILAEAKLVLRRGRRPSGEAPESYVQWTKNFHESLCEGALTDLDLDLYFSWNRPGAGNLHRHLNKVWHGGKRPRVYERDLREVACGHLGMRDSKDLKRNFHKIVEELEAKNYVTPMPDTQRFLKVRPGVWRVRFELHPDQVRGTTTRGEGSAANQTTDRKQQTRDAATELVALFHRHRFGREKYEPKSHERKQARGLLAQFDAELLETLMPHVAEILKTKFPDARFFGAAVPYFEKAAEVERARTRKEAKQKQQLARRTDAQRSAAEEKHRRAADRKRLLTKWRSLSAKQQSAYFDQARKHATSTFDRQRLAEQDFAHPPREVLDLLARDRHAQ